MVACLGLATTPLLLAAITMGWPGDGRGVGLIYASVAVTGMVRAFLGPVYNALFARVLPREQFANGASLGSIVFQAGLVVGPAIGGVLVGSAGKHVRSEEHTSELQSLMSISYAVFCLKK